MICNRKERKDITQSAQRIILLSFDFASFAKPLRPLRLKEQKQTIINYETTHNRNNNERRNRPYGNKSAPYPFYC